MFSSLLSLNKTEALPTEIAEIEITQLPEELLKVCIDEILNVYGSMQLGIYYASKSKDTIKKLDERLKRLIYTDNKG
jgi:hypothetical protein